MEGVPFTRIAGVLPLVRCLERAGAPVERLAHRAGVPSWQFDRPEALVPMHLACRFYGLAARALGCPDLGVRIGQATESFSLGLYGQILARCGSVYEGLRTAVACLPQFASGHVDRLEEERDRVWLVMGLCDGIGVGLRQVQAFVLTMTIHTLQEVAGPNWLPEQVRVPDHGREWIEGLGLNTSIVAERGGREVAVAIPRRLLPVALGLEAASPESPLRERLVATAPPTSFVDSLRAAIGVLLPEGCPSLRLLSEAAGMKTRTLQRRLSEAGLTFSSLLDRCRMERARELLGRPDARAIDVAYELGYHDPGNFTRAFRRWAGVTPREYRHQVAGHA